MRPRPFDCWQGEDAVREYIQNQEKEEHRLEQLNLWR